MADDFQRGSGNGDSPIDFNAQQIPEQLGSYAKWGAVIIGIIVIISVLSFLRTVYTDWIWFDNLGFKGVFIKVLITRVILFAIGAAIFSVLISISIFIAFRLSRGEVTLPIPAEALVFIHPRCCESVCVFTSGASEVLLIGFSRSDSSRPVSCFALWLACDSACPPEPLCCAGRGVDEGWRGDWSRFALACGCP